MKQKDIELIYDDDINYIFTDIVHIHVSMESVTLELGIRDNENKTGKVSTKIIMTVPHFIRFAEVCTNLSKSVQDQLEKLKSEKK